MINKLTNKTRCHQKNYLKVVTLLFFEKKILSEISCCIINIRNKWVSEWILYSHYRFVIIFKLEFYDNDDTNKNVKRGRERVHKGWDQKRNQYSRYSGLPISQSIHMQCNLLCECIIHRRAQHIHNATLSLIRQSMRYVVGSHINFLVFSFDPLIPTKKTEFNPNNNELGKENFQLNQRANVLFFFENKKCRNYLLCQSE